MELVMMHDLIDPKTGESYKAGNLKLKHNIPLGTLVELDWSGWHGGGACWRMQARLFVTRHDRDCDGTPLYSVSRFTTPGLEDFHNFPESMLTPVEVTSQVHDGYDLPEWFKDEDNT